MITTTEIDLFVPLMYLSGAVVFTSTVMAVMIGVIFHFMQSKVNRPVRENPWDNFDWNIYEENEVIDFVPSLPLPKKKWKKPHNWRLEGF